jgi:hypothetical protein
VWGGGGAKKNIESLGSRGIFLWDRSNFPLCKKFTAFLSPFAFADFVSVVATSASRTDLCIDKAFVPVRQSSGCPRAAMMQSGYSSATTLKRGALKPKGCACIVTLFALFFIMDGSPERRGSQALLRPASYKQKQMMCVYRYVVCVLHHLTERRGSVRNSQALLRQSRLRLGQRSLGVGLGELGVRLGSLSIGGRLRSLGGRLGNRRLGGRVGNRRLALRLQRLDP